MYSVCHVQGWRVSIAELHGKDGKQAVYVQKAVFLTVKGDFYLEIFVACFEP